ncbi:hypothetical protein N9435_09890 [Pseudomonadales bacterium]|nr:hypothetical protein [Pseudomonadales bacterium]MDC0893393.1 hypothetical protein [Pseudomonadales bacterium]
MLQAAPILEALLGMRMIRFLFLTFLFPVSALALDLPEGWRYPTKKGLSDDYSVHFSAELVKATGDYNGDSKVVTALILVSTEFQGDGLFIHLSNPNGYSWLPLNIDNWDKTYPDKGYIYSGLNMGIDTLSVQDTKKLIQRSIQKFESDPPKDKTITTESLSYFRLESAGSLFYWSKSENKFIRYWYSD